MKHQSSPCPGRRRELRSLMSRLQSGLSGPPGSALVIGEPGFGKSLFLDQAADPTARKEALGPLADRLSFCPVRVPPEDGLDEQTFLGMMRRALDGGVVEDPGARSTEADLERALQERIEERGMAHVFLVDDFHRISQSSSFSVPFFSFLRYLGYNLRAGYVLSSRLDIGEMAVRQEVQASPFWNIFSKIRMGPLAEEQSREVLDASLSSISGIDESHLRVLEPLAGGVPFLLAALADAVTAAVGDEDAWDGTAILRATLERAGGALNQTWAALKEPWKQALGALLVDGGSLSAEEHDALLPLADAGYLDRDSLRVRGLALRWDWTRRLGGDPEPLTGDVLELPPLRSSLLARLFRR